MMISPVSEAMVSTADGSSAPVAAIVDRDEIFDIYVSLAVLRPGPSVIPAYPLAALNSPFCDNQFRASLKGFGVHNLHLKNIRRATIPVPPLNLQRAFAARIAESGKGDLLDSRRPQTTCYERFVRSPSGLWASLNAWRR
jgi:type I restriction enzyme S subunit